MTVNRVMAVTLRYFTQCGSFGANSANYIIYMYIKLVEIRPVLSAVEM